MTTDDLTPRDIFAMFALTSLLTSHKDDDATPLDYAESAYTLADAMLKARKPPADDFLEEDDALPHP